MVRRRSTLFSGLRDWWTDRQFSKVWRNLDTTRKQIELFRYILNTTENNEYTEGFIGFAQRRLQHYEDLESRLLSKFEDIINTF